MHGVVMTAGVAQLVASAMNERVSAGHLQAIEIGLIMSAVTRLVRHFSNSSWKSPVAVLAISPAPVAPLTMPLEGCLHQKI